VEPLEILLAFEPEFFLLALIIVLLLVLLYHHPLGLPDVVRRIDDCPQVLEPDGRLVNQLRGDLAPDLPHQLYIHGCIAVQVSHVL